MVFINVERNFFCTLYVFSLCQLLLEEVKAEEVKALFLSYFCLYPSQWYLGSVCFSSADLCTLTLPGLTSSLFIVYRRLLGMFTTYLK